MSKMTESELKAILSAEIADSIGHIGGELSEQRRKALDYYLGQPFGNEIEGRSKVVSTDVADTIEWYNDAEWVIYGDGDGAHGVAYASATGFSVVGANVAAVYHPGRRVKAVGTLTGTIYGTIATSIFSSNTAVTVTWDTGALQNEALTVYLSILSRANSALPANAARTDIASTFTAPQTFNGAVTLGAALNEAAEIAIASAATVNIGAAASSNLLVTGTAAITSLGTANAGIRRLLRFAGALTLTHNATSLILPGGASIVTAVNDTAEFLSLGAGNWVCVGYLRRDGTPAGFSLDSVVLADNPPTGALVAGAIGAGAANGRKFRIGEIGGWAVLEEQTASGNAERDFNVATYSADFDDFRFVLDYVTPSIDATNLLMRFSTDNGATYDAAASDYSYAQSGVGTGAGFDGNGNAAVPHIIVSSANLSNPVGNAANKGVSGSIDLFNPAATGQQTRVQFHVTHRRASDGLFMTYIGTGCRNVSQKTTNVRFLFSGVGNVLASGRVTMLGRRKIQ